MMKNIFLFCGILLVISSCDLAVQKTFEFQEGVPEFVTFKNETVLDWLKRNTTPPGAPTNGTAFDSLVKAITLTNLEAEYSTNPSDRRTFLLLTNNSFTNTGANKIMRDLGNVKDIAAIPKARLEKLLRYHIVEDYVHQIETLPTWGRFKYFQTLVPGEEGTISFVRNERYALTVNNGPRIPTSTRKFTNVYLHNYQFKNGIAHQLNLYVRYSAF